jgi:hypothetical protein
MVRSFAERDGRVTALPTLRLADISTLANLHYLLHNVAWMSI